MHIVGSTLPACLAALLPVDYVDSVVFASFECILFIIRMRSRWLKVLLRVGLRWSSSLALAMMHPQEEVDGQSASQSDDDVTAPIARPSSGAICSSKRCPACDSAKGAMTKKYHGYWFHSECFLGIRARHSQLKQGAGGSLEAVKADTEMMVASPSKWRGKLRPFIPGLSPAQGSSGPSSRAEARKQAQMEARKFVKTANVSEKVDINDVMKLNKKQFKYHKKNNEGQPDDEASAEFDELLTQQDGKYSKEGVERVGVEDIERDRTILGKRTEDGVIEEV